MTKNTISVALGQDTLNFAIDDKDINRYLDEQAPNEKINSAYNMLARTVIDSDKEKLKNLALSSDGITPRGVVVMQVAGVLVAEFGGDLDITIKKPKAC